MLDRIRNFPCLCGRELLLAAGLSLFTTCSYLVVLTPLLLFEELSAIWGDDPYSISACHVVDGGRLAVLCFWAPSPKADDAPRRYVATIDLESDPLRVHSVQPSTYKWLTASEIPGKQLVAVNFSGELTHIPLGPRKADKSLTTLFNGMRLRQFQSINHRFVAAVIALELSVWDLEQQKSVWSLAGATVAGIVAVPTRESIVALLTDGRIMEVSARTGELVRDPTFLSSPGCSASISSDGRRLAVVTGADEVRILSLPTERGPWTDVSPEAPGIPVAGTTVSISPNGEFLVTSTEHGATTLMLWRISTRQCIQTLEGDGNIIQGAAFCNDSELLTWSHGGQLYRWDFRRGTKELWSPRAATQAPWKLSSLWPKSMRFLRT